MNIEEIVKMVCYNLQEIAQKRKNSLQNATTKLEPKTGLEMRAGLEPAPTFYIPYPFPNVLDWS